ncbi:hypothetical protein ANN_10946 [Periplaneta americana]|uniref:Transposase Tc1-like domain-containing protein n=1 Tax=Periplaneta americana TaxID=6978 RepID=A0ABQ8T4U8_PERAM|nr:hypothetical protein ANN_10946 [Periplaneta americana]
MDRCSKSHREIAAALNVSKTCVTNTIKKFHEQGEVVDKPRSGRPRVTSLREDRIIARVAKRNRKASLPGIMKEFEDTTHKKVSKMTISRRLGEAGLQSYVPLKKPLLNNTHKRNRRNWCKTRKNWYMEHWGKVMFSDESRFVLYSSRKVRVRRTPTEKFLPECLVPAVQGGGSSVMIWGCMSAAGTGILRFIDGSMDSQEYIETMKDNMLPSAQKLYNGYFVFQQDNAPCHKSAATMAWFERKGILALASKESGPEPH